MKTFANIHATVYSVLRGCAVVACAVGGLVLMAASCANPTPVTPTTATLTQKTVSNLRPDSVARFLYFSFDTDTTVALSQVNTDAWDIRLRFIPDGRQAQSLDVVVNSGVPFPNGRTIGLTIDSTYDLVTTAPADAQMRTEDTAFARRIVPMDFVSNSVLLYNPVQRTISVNPQKTMTFKTARGNYVKMQIISVYQNAIAAPTITTPVGYYTFRYTKSNTRQLK